MSVRVIILTSTFRRHQFVANYLSTKVQVLGVWQEQKSFNPQNYAKTSGDHTLIKRHFADRDLAEESFFGPKISNSMVADIPHYQVSVGGINEPNEIQRMVALQPDVCVVFGTGLLKSKIIKAFEGHLLNIHLGLSPYYRGAGTNFWPLVNREPEYVGATIHYLDEGIDTGPIIGHVRPEIRLGDGPHDLGNRAIEAAAKGMVATVISHYKGHVHATPQTSKGKLYQRKEFSADAVRRLYRQFSTGMIEQYLSDRKARDERLDLLNIKVA